MSFALNACQTTITIVLSRNADGRIGISTSSSPVARGGRSARRSAPVFRAAAQDPVACTPRQETDGLDLFSLMIGPVQHFPRYRSLLEEMQRSARPRRALLRAAGRSLRGVVHLARTAVGRLAGGDIGAVRDALGAVRPRLDKANERIREFEAQCRVPLAQIVRVASRPSAGGPTAVVRGRDARAVMQSAYAARGNTHRGWGGVHCGRGGVPVESARLWLPAGELDRMARGRPRRLRDQPAASARAARGVAAQRGSGTRGVIFCADCLEAGSAPWAAR